MTTPPTTPTPRTDGPEKAYQATPAATLHDRIMDSRIAKNETEWWAKREIERLETQLTAEQEKVRVLRKVLVELFSAMIRYEGDVDGEAPTSHTLMMERARSALAATAPKEGA